jgi:hypothetical protein
MNLNIVNDAAYTLAGYTNLIFGKDIQVLTDLPYESGQIRECILNHIISLQNFTPSVLDSTIKLIGVGGKITVIDVDAQTILNSISNFTVDIERINRILYNDNRKACYTSNYITQILTNNGFKIIKHRIDNHEYTITAIRI